MAARRDVVKLPNAIPKQFKRARRQLETIARRRRKQRPFGAEQVGDLLDIELKIREIDEILGRLELLCFGGLQPYPRRPRGK